MSSRSKCCIIGIADHQGVFNVGGRIGAAYGPKEFFKIFRKLKSKNPVLSSVIDWGEIKGFGENVAKNHELASELIKKAHGETRFSVVIGGGHDHGFSHLRGILEAIRPQMPFVHLGCINIDAHLDVRKPVDMITSGSPFYLALENGVLHSERFVEFGIQSHCNSAELWEYVEMKRVKVIPFEKLRFGKAVQMFEEALSQLAVRSDFIVISLDLDAIAQAYAPGVSAPQAEGFTSSEILEILEISALHPKVVSLGIFELNPFHDFENCTSRMAATAAYRFVEKALF